MQSAKNKIKIILENKFLCEVSDWPKRMEDLVLLDQKLQNKPISCYYYNCENEKKTLETQRDFDLLSSSLNSCRPKIRELYIEYHGEYFNCEIPVITEEIENNHMDLLQSEYIYNPPIADIKAKELKVKTLKEIQSIVKRVYICV